MISNREYITVYKFESWISKLFQAGILNFPILKTTSNTITNETSKNKLQLPTPSFILPQFIFKQDDFTLLFYIFDLETLLRDYYIEKSYIEEYSPENLDIYLKNKLTQLQNTYNENNGNNIDGNNNNSNGNVNNLYNDIFGIDLKIDNITGNLRDIRVVGQELLRFIFLFLLKPEIYQFITGQNIDGYIEESIKRLGNSDWYEFIFLNEEIKAGGLFPSIGNVLSDIDINYTFIKGLKSTSPNKWIVYGFYVSPPTIQKYLFVDELKLSILNDLLLNRVVKTLEKYGYDFQDYPSFQLLPHFFIFYYVGRYNFPKYIPDHKVVGNEYERFSCSDLSFFIFNDFSSLHPLVQGRGQVLNKILDSYIHNLLNSINKFVIEKVGGLCSETNSCPTKITLEFLFRNLYSYGKPPEINVNPYEFDTNKSIVGYIRNSYHFICRII